MIFSMCGISGRYGGPEIHEEGMRSMTSSMRHRGPDGEGVFVNHAMGLGHRRLRVIDLSSDADQPLFNETKDLGVVFNGEIYNFLELRQELTRKGHRFRSRSDTEVIIHAFEEWGTDCFVKFNGIFAFALWDGRQGRQILYLARDRFGAKPLFYSFKEGKLAFASELKPLLGLPWISKKVNPDTLFLFLKFGHVPNPLSIIDDVMQLRPGTWIRFENGAIAEHTFWDPCDFAAAPNQDRSEEEWLGLLEQTLHRVVKRQLVSDVPVGCFLSGGIDSSLLVMAHHELQASPLKTFTIGYRESSFDESSHAQEVAKIFGTDHHVITAGPEDYFQLIRQLPLYFDQPFGDPTAISSMLLSKFAKEEVTVVLSGDGGDELFFGYPYQRALYFLKPLLNLPDFLRKGFFASLPRLGRTRSSYLQRADKLMDILQFNNKPELFQYFIGTVGPLRMDRLASLLNEPVNLKTPFFSALLEQVKALPWEEQIQQVFLRTFLLDTVLAKTDRAAMAYGLEGRVPFLDNEMVEFAARLPFHWKYRNGKGKYLTRRLMEKRISPSLSRRPKQGFSIPLRDWLKSDLRYLLDEYLDPIRLKREGLFNASQIKQLVRAHLGNYANHSHLLWSLISFQMWKERYAP